MLGNLLAFDSSPCFCFSTSYPLANVHLSNGFPPNVTCPATFTSSKWRSHSTLKTGSVVVLSDEDRKTWDTCRQALSTFEFSGEEEDKILGKAFGLVHSPYWGEEREKQVPKFEVVSDILDYLRSLSLSDGELCKVLKKFPEVLGCSLDNELKANVQLLEKEWGIKGKSLRNLLLRNPKVLGYNVDCKGDCMAQCTRCWLVKKYGTTRSLEKVDEQKMVHKEISLGSALMIIIMVSTQRILRVEIYNSDL